MNPLEWPPCCNKRDHGWCGECAFCLRRLYGPEWWLFLYPPAIRRPESNRSGFKKR